MVLEDFNESQRDLLQSLASRLIWWETAEEAVERPAAVILQGMDIGTIDDLFAMEKVFGKEVLKTCLSQAGAGQLRPKSWFFWHYRLGVTPTDQEAPPMPVRTFGADGRK